MENQGRFISYIKILLIISFFNAVAYAEINGRYIAGEYVVKLKDSVDLMTLQQLNLFIESIGGKVRDNDFKKSKTILVQRSILEKPETVITELSKNPSIEIAEPNYIYDISDLPNDTRLNELWGLKNKNKSIGDIDIDAERAWSIEKGNSTVVVAVIDTGVNYNHADLKNNMWVNLAEANGSVGIDDDGNGFIDDIYGYDFVNEDGDPIDDNDHGSHCAGTIGAEGDNGLGIVGVNWDVSIMALKFLSESGGGTLENAIRAIDYATQMQVDVMSNSWGGGGESELLKAAIQRAENSGILFIAAAGNASNNNDLVPSYPASYNVPNVISVAAVDTKGRLADFSNFGASSVHIAAPGVDILSTNKSGSYVEFSGTSMATPHVSGVAALLLAHSPQLSYQDLKDRLLNTSYKKVTLRNKVSHGLLNAYNALTNTVPERDPDDPSLWFSKSVEYSTPHPYSNNFEQSFHIRVPGAKRVSVHFVNFETEKGFDKALFYDSQGNQVGEMSGKLADSYSPAAKGDTITVRFLSDKSIAYYGFDIDQVNYK